MSKVTIVGAGNVGGTCADIIASREVADELVLIDIKEGFAEGKATDINQTRTLRDFDTKVCGVTGDWKATAGSDVVVITSGIPRKPGMTREELIGVNAGIVGDVAKNILAHSPDAILLIVSNPMDTMTYLATKLTGLPRNRVFGMGGALDTSRFRYYLAKALNVCSNDVDGMVIGGHGDTTMIPLIGKASYRGVAVSSFADEATLSQVVADTMVGGATLTKLIGTSAWYAPGAAVAMVVEGILRDQKCLIPSCVMLDGEYGYKDVCIGVPTIIGHTGAERIVELELSESEKTEFAKSIEAVKSTNNILKEIKAL